MPERVHGSKRRSEAASGPGHGRLRLDRDRQHHRCAEAEGDVEQHLDGLVWRQVRGMLGGLSRPVPAVVLHVLA